MNHFSSLFFLEPLLVPQRTFFHNTISGSGLYFSVCASLKTEISWRDGVSDHWISGVASSFCFLGEGVT